MATTFTAIDLLILAIPVVMIIVGYAGKMKWLAVIGGFFLVPVAFMSAFPLWIVLLLVFFSLAFSIGLAMEAI